MSCKRPAAILARQRIAAYYASNEQLVEQEQEDERTDKRVTREVLERTRDLHYAVDRIRTLLQTLDALPEKTPSSERIPLITQVFELLVEFPSLLERYPRLRETVYQKINQLTRDLDEQVDRRVINIQVHTDAIYKELKGLSHGANFMYRLADWTSDLTHSYQQHESYLRSLFRKILENRCD